jgi:hypothetical protein
MEDGRYIVWLDEELARQARVAAALRGQPLSRALGDAVVRVLEKIAAPPVGSSPRKARHTTPSVPADAEDLEPLEDAFQRATDEARHGRVAHSASGEPPMRDTRDTPTTQAATIRRTVLVPKSVAAALRRCAGRAGVSLAAYLADELATPGQILANAPTRFADAPEQLDERGETDQIQLRLPVAVDQAVRSALAAARRRRGRRVTPTWTQLLAALAWQCDPWLRADPQAARAIVAELLPDTPPPDGREFYDYLAAWLRRLDDDAPALRRLARLRVDSGVGDNESRWLAAAVSAAAFEGELRPEAALPLLPLLRAAPEAAALRPEALRLLLKAAPPDAEALADLPRHLAAHALDAALSLARAARSVERLDLHAQWEPEPASKAARAVKAWLHSALLRSLWQPLNPSLPSSPHPASP